MSDIPPTPPAPAGDPTDNSVIREMRAALEAANAAKKLAEDAAAAHQAKLTEIERSKLEENERLKLEIQDRDKKLVEAQSIRDEHGRFQSAFETLYTAELASIPEAQRPVVEALSKSGSWPDRLAALQGARSLLGTAPAPPAVGGTRTQPPGTPPPTDPPAATPVDPKNPPRLSGIPWKK